jgi:hypothetical protein
MSLMLCGHWQCIFVQAKVGEGREQGVAESRLKEQGKTRRDRVLECIARKIQKDKRAFKGFKWLLIGKENDIKAKVLCCGQGLL